MTSQKIFFFRSICTASYRTFGIWGFVAYAIALCETSEYTGDAKVLKHEEWCTVNSQG